MKSKVDSTKVYFAVVHRESLTVIKLLLTAGEARSYIKPLIATDEYQIERVYLDPYVGRTYLYLLTFLDRPSCKSIPEALRTRKIQKLRIWIPVHIRSTFTVFHDRRLKGLAKEVVQRSVLKLQSQLQLEAQQEEQNDGITL